MTRPDRPWLDPALTTDERVEALLAVMTLEEKVGQTHQVANITPEDEAAIRAGGVSSSLYASGATAGNERDEGMLVGNIDSAQRIAVEGSRLGIPLLFGRDVIHGHRTVFPIPLGLAAAFDVDLAEETARVAAEEATLEGVAWAFAPMMDVSEEPRWGRVAESLGEQPVLAGRLAAGMVRGFQGEDPSDRRRLAACAKHFVGYGLSTGGRDYNTVTVGENTLRNLHLRPFRDAVRAGVTTVMAAFNDVDGTPMHSHRRLLREVLKDEWGFDGVVVADWNGIGQLVRQGVAGDLRGAARLALEAGVDLDMCSGAYAGYLADLVRSGEVDEALLDDAVRRVLRLKVRLGLFEHPYAGDLDGSPAPTGGTRALARRAARAAHVLVSNDGVLPLDPSGDERILLTGGFVDDGDALLGTWVLDGRGEEVVTPADALRERLGEEPGVAFGRRLDVLDGRFPDQVLEVARRASKAVMLLGEHRGRSGEDRCVTDIGLPPGQLDVLRHVAALGTPVVAVVYTGRPLDLTEVLDLASAVVVVWHPGVEAGSALADVLVGDVEPHGRLPMTFPLSVGHLPTSTHQRPTGRPIPVERDRFEGRYVDALTHSRLPFGRGLSYTTVEYGEPSVEPATVPVDGGAATVRVAVSNTGSRPCREVVQLYAHDPVADVTRPEVELVTWQAVDLAPGERRVVELAVSSGDFAYAGRDLTERVDTGEVVLLAGPDAATLRPVTLTFA
jgi:beta-glucosidase